MMADALVYAVTYINCREDETEEYLHDDVGALESIAGLLADVTDAEKEALAAAAKSALEREQARASPRDNFVEDYSTWMEDVFGEEWVGNVRKWSSVTSLKNVCATKTASTFATDEDPSCN